MAVARDLSGGKNNVIAVIGDGSMSAGMAYEAMNNAGAMNSRLIVILNDNDMSIAPPVGAMSAYLSRLYSGKTYRTLREAAKQLGTHLPKIIANRASRVEEYSRGFMMDGGTLFEELGFYYVGPIDGHNLDHLLPVLKNVRDMETGPILVHVVTQKGKGYGPAEASADKYHAVVKFDVATGAQAKAKPNAPAYQNVFGQSLVKEAEKDDKIVAITAAMPSGTGVDIFNKAFPDRTFDVGIAEQHAVTFAAGLATEGYKPFCAIYSTFLQRGYDQIVHDVAIQSLPVRFAIDRAGLVGADGATHAGSFDNAYLGCLPNFVIMAASDEAELVHMVATAGRDQRPSERGALSARRRPRRRNARSRHSPGNRQGPHRPRGQQDRPAVVRHPPGRMRKGRRRTGRPWPLHHDRRRALHEAARRRPGPEAGARARSAAHHRGRLDRRLRLPRHADAVRPRHARRRPADARDDPARRVPSTTTRRTRCMPTPASTPRASSPRCSTRSARTSRPRRSSSPEVLQREW